MVRRRIGAALVCVVLFICCVAADQQCDRNTDIVQFLVEPFSSTSDVEARLACLLEVYYDSEDFRGVFLSVYYQATIGVVQKIDQGDFFINDAWVGEYLVTFAEKYRMAVIHDKLNTPWLSIPWKQAMEPDQDLVLIIQDLLLAMNAHINFDLCQAIQASGITPRFVSKYRDHTKINKILSEVYGKALDILAVHYQPALKNVTRILDPLLSIGTDMMLALMRQVAWDNAVTLNGLKSGTKAFDAYVGMLEIQAGIVGDAITILDIDKTLFQLLKLAEGPNPLQTFCCWMPSACNVVPRGAQMVAQC